VADVQERLGERSPFGLMALASGLIEATTARPMDRWDRASVDRPDGPSTFLTFAQSGFPAMGALALAVTAMHPDEVLARRLRGAVDPTVVRVGPAWLASMAQVEITGTWLQTHVLGDGESLLVSWQWPAGPAATAAVYVDHNMGTLVKDAFVVPEDGAKLISSTGLQDPHMEVSTIDPGEARARISEATYAYERTIPPIETDSWPSCRPMVEWVLRHLPGGGAGYVRPDWPEADRERLLDDFIASPHATIDALTPEQVRELADPLIWFGCDYGPGDPLRWSPVSAEIMLTDWYPRKVVDLDDDAKRLPDVLAAFVRFTHQRTDVPADLTGDTLDAVEHSRPDFAKAIGRSGRSPFGGAPRMAPIAAGLRHDDDDDQDDWFTTDNLDQLDELDELDKDELDEIDEIDEIEMTAIVDDLEERLLELVGGADAYHSLDEEPLTDMPFDWSQIPSELHEPTSDTLGQLDQWASELFDDEVRTIGRAVLAAIIAADPSVFKRSARTDTLAAGVLGYLLRHIPTSFPAIERHQMPWAVTTMKAFADATGVSAGSVGARSQTIANVAERAHIDWPSILHSTQRREALRTTQLISEWRNRDAPGHQA
jgi:hypothetical protein